MTAADPRERLHLDRERGGVRETTGLAVKASGLRMEYTLGSGERLRVLDGVDV